MKGSNKQFSKFLESEYNDDYLEPLEDKNTLNLLKMAETQKNVKQIPSPQNTGKHETKLVQSQLKQTSLIKKMVQELNAQLGQDARDCVENLKTIEVIYSTHIIEAYKDLQTKYETLPALFFSVTPDQIVYLWQINRMSPYKKDNDLAVDASSMNAKACPHLSFLLLAKIKSDEQGEIVDANILGDSALYTKIKGPDNEQIIRFYNIEAFRNIAKINPFAQEMVANKYYSHRIVIKGYKNEADQALNNLEISCWKKDLGEQEVLIGQETLEGIPNLDNNGGIFDFHFNEIHRTSNGTTVLLGKSPATIIAFKGNKLVVAMNKGVQVGQVNRTKTDLMFYDKDGKIHDVGLINFPNIDLEKTSETISKGQQSKLSEWKLHESKCQRAMLAFNKYYPTEEFHDGLFVYKVSVSLINPFLIKNGEIKQDNQEEKKEENIVEKIDKMKAEFKNTAQNEKDTMQEKKELLKEIRADISSKNAEGRKFDKAYQEAQKDYWNKKKMDPPEGVTKETLELYNEIKAEKKKLEREREKQKTDKNKRSRSGKNEY